MRIKLGELKKLVKEAGAVHNRNRHTGQYTYSSNFERMCVCGHSLAVHTGEAPHSCMNDDTYAGGTGEACDCEKFRLARGKKAPTP